VISRQRVREEAEARFEFGDKENPGEIEKRHYVNAFIARWHDLLEYHLQEGEEEWFLSFLSESDPRE